MKHLPAVSDHKMNPNRSRGSWMVTLPLAAGSIAYIVFAFLPGRQAATELQSQIQQKQQYLAHAGSLAAATVAAEEELRLAEQYRDQWRENAPSAAQVASLYAKIHQVETASGVRTTRFDPQPFVSREYLTELPLTLGCTGRFAEVFALVRGLECLPADIWIKRLHIEKSTANAMNVQCRMDLVIFADNQEKSDYVNNSD